MEKRVNVHIKGQAAMKAMHGLGAYVHGSTLEESLQHLICMRVSQINGCAFCIDMHSKDAASIGETEQRLYLLNAWRETPFYTERERAAFAWAEAMTVLKGGTLPSEVYAEAAKHFTEQELIDLNMAVITINAYNRINIAFPVKVGTYQPGQFQL